MLQQWQRIKTPFTFHYASTLSSSRLSQFPADSHLHSTMLLLYQDLDQLRKTSRFDLHSTMLLLYQESRRRGLPIIIYLHSTMLLLYHVRKRPSGNITLIYIPLCFYFIHHADIHTLYHMTFTFHYASTLSSKSPPYSFPVQNLHSTMLLLYPYGL